MTLEELKAEMPAGGYAYLGSPYSLFADGLHAAFTRACLLTGKLLRNGIPTFSPIAHSHPVAQICKIDPLDYELWIPADMPLVRNAALMLVADLDGWDTSWGVEVEIAAFKDAGKPVLLIHPETLALAAL